MKRANKKKATKKSPGNSRKTRKEPDSHAMVSFRMPLEQLGVARELARAHNESDKPGVMSVSELHRMAHKIGLAALQGK